MSDTPSNPNGAPAGASGGAGAVDPNNPPSLSVLAQYLKDLSFENPRAPQSFQGEGSPKIDVNVDVQARPLGTDQYEVELSLAARAKRDEDAVFVVEATYAGAFEIKNLPREQLEMIMLVECPRLLFPFMRQIVAEATRNGNFPPLMLEPIDFMGIYMANAEKRRQEQGQGAPLTV